MKDADKGDQKCGMASVREAVSCSCMEKTEGWGIKQFVKESKVAGRE